MSREIAYLPEVSRDFVDAYHYYSALSEKLGEKFECAYYEAEKEIEDNLIKHRTVFDDYRRVVLRKFPYLLYYRDDAGKAVIAGLLFGKRDPKEIKRLLKSRSE